MELETAAAGRRQTRRGRQVGASGAALVAALLALAAVRGVAAENRPPAPAPSPAASQLLVTAIHVTPPTPGADTLCQLRVEVKNGGERVASQLAFTVKVNGHELPVYGRQLFMQRLD